MNKGYGLVVGAFVFMKKSSYSSNIETTRWKASGFEYFIPAPTVSTVVFAKVLISSTEGAASQRHKFCVQFQKIIDQTPKAVSALF